MKIYLYICVLNMLLFFAFQFLFINENLLYATSIDIHEVLQIEKNFKATQEWQWIGYAIIPVVILLRVFYTSVFIYTGLFFADISAGFGKIFNVALWADFAFVLSGVAKLVILIFFKEVSTLHDLQFQPLSLMELFNQAAVDTLFIYPLSLLNLFELGYFVALAWLFKELLNEEQPETSFGFCRSLRLVGVSYGSGLLLWVIIVMFITLNLS